MKEFEKLRISRSKQYCRSLVLSSLLLFYATNETFASQFDKIDAATPRITVHIGNTTLVEAFKKLENHGVLVFYSNNIDKPNKSVNVHADNKTLNEVFDNLLAGTNNTYSIEGRQVFVKRKAAAGATGLRQGNETAKQELEASGRVFSEDGKPIGGASVTVVGTMTSAATDDSGHFKIKVPNGRAKLSISYVGYETQQVNAGLDIRVTFIHRSCNKAEC